MLVFVIFYTYMNKKTKFNRKTMQKQKKTEMSQDMRQN